MLRVRKSGNTGVGISRAKSLFLLSVVFALVVGSASYFKNDGIRNVVDVEKKLEHEKKEVERLQAENNLLRRRIKSIQEGSYLMEKFAREKLMLGKENEVIFRFYEDSANNL